MTIEIRSRQIFSASLFPPWRSSTTNRRYLCHFEKLGQFGHPVEESLVDLQSFFALVLLHVKVFLCVSEDQNPIRSLFTHKCGKSKGLIRIYFIPLR